MKTKIVYISALLLIACCVNAQDSKCFEKTGESRSLVSFQLKGRVQPKLHKPIDAQPTWRFNYTEDFVKKASEAFKESFKDRALDLTKLPKIHFFFIFDGDCRIVHYAIDYPKNRLSEFPDLEDGLARFCEMMEKEVDIHPYVRIFNKEKFEYGNFMTNTLYLARYLQDPKSVMFDQ